MQDIQVPVLPPYNNNEITVFEKEGAMINAARMAKPFNKKPTDWLRLSGTKRFLLELSTLRNISVEDLAKSVKGNFTDSREQGTWLHQEAALEFARWLSPAFAIWCNDQVRGHSAAVYNPLFGPVVHFEEAVHEQDRKVEYHDAVLQSRTLIPANVIAKELGMSAIALNKLLHAKKVIYKSNEHWVLYADYCGKGYTGTKTAIFRDSGGNYQSNIHTYWTEKGREFIHALVKEAQQVA